MLRKYAKIQKRLQGLNMIITFFLFYFIVWCSTKLCSESITFHNVYYPPISSVISSLGLNHHLYADDTQIFFSFHPCNFSSSITHLKSALEHISSWTTANQLTLNSSKQNFFTLVLSNN